MKQEHPHVTSVSRGMFLEQNEDVAPLSEVDVNRGGMTFPPGPTTHVALVSEDGVSRSGKMFQTVIM